MEPSNDQDILQQQLFDKLMTSLPEWIQDIKA
jgi:hypothetical protein